MAEKGGERRLCTNCGTTPLRGDNTSGVCVSCRRAPKRGRDGKAAVGPPAEKPQRVSGRRRPRVPRGDGATALQAEKLAAVADLPDEYLAACVVELRERKERIQEEAAERVQRLERALKEGT